MTDDTEKADKQKKSKIHELEFKLNILHEGMSDLIKNKERLEIEIKKTRALLHDDTKELAEIKARMFKEEKELEEKEKALAEIEKQILNHQAEAKKIDNETRSLRRN